MVESMGFAANFEVWIPVPSSHNSVPWGSRISNTQFLHLEGGTHENIYLISHHEDLRK